VGATDQEKPELAFEQGGRFVVRGADGRRTAVHFDFGENPPWPEPAPQEEFSLEEADRRGPSPTAPAGEDEWGLSDRRS
jgi:hypothetical protein